jgi:hypothetical protein
VRSAIMRRLLGLSTFQIRNTTHGDYLHNTGPYVIEVAHQKWFKSQIDSLGISSLILRSYSDLPKENCEGLECICHDLGSTEM